MPRNGLQLRNAGNGADPFRGRMGLPWDGVPEQGILAELRAVLLGSLAHGLFGCQCACEDRRWLSEWCPGTDQAPERSSHDGWALIGHR